MAHGHCSGWNYRGGKKNTNLSFFKENTLMVIKGQHEKLEFQEATDSEKNYNYIFSNTFLEICLALGNCVLKTEVRKISHSKCTTLPGGMILMSKESGGLAWIRKKRSSVYWSSPVKDHVSENRENPEGMQVHGH